VPLSKSVFNPTYPAKPVSFGANLRKIRMDAGLQIKELAKAAGLDEMTIVNWEQGRTSPRKDKLKELIRILRTLNPDFEKRVLC
jgi:transcriptional regulator with XRE-family HTH domain